MLDSRTYRVEYGGEIAELTGAVWGSELVNKALVNPNNRNYTHLPQPTP